MKRIGLTGLLLCLALFSAGCGSRWEVMVRGLPGGDKVLNYQIWKEYEDFADEDAIPLEQFFYGFGARVINKVTITDGDNKTQVLDWAQSAEEVLVKKNGSIRLGEEELKPASLVVELSAWEKRVEGQIYDIAPTAAAVLGIPAPALATGAALPADPAQAVLLLFLDGFGYLRYQESLEGGLIPELAKLDPPLIGLTTYPPITTVSTASLLTGTEPPIHGVEVRGIRITETQTLFDVAAQAGLETAAVEGEALAFNLRNTDQVLSGDRDGNGGSDDNVLLNSLAVLENGMPDLFLVHFHGIDDQGHNVGPGAKEEIEKIREVDAAVGEILSRLPEGTMVVIFADHGMHLVDEEGRMGNHGHLIPRDMLIPIWVFRVEN